MLNFSLFVIASVLTVRLTPRVSKNSLSSGCLGIHLLGALIGQPWPPSPWNHTC